MPTLAELRAGRPIRRPERTRTICTTPDLVSEVMALTAELDQIPAAPRRRHDSDDGDTPPSRMGDGEHPRADEIRRQLADLLATMAAGEGELTVRAIEDGEWIRWVQAHPARSKEDDPQGYARDIEVAAGYCNADDLIEDLGMWAYSWDGDPLGEGDWDLLAATIARPDKKELARDVVGMHEKMGSGLPKWRADLSATLGRFSVVEPPAQPDGPHPSTSAGSQPSDTSTTTPTTS